MTTPSPGDRSKASRIRNARKPSAADRAWLARYDAARKSKPARSRPVAERDDDDDAPELAPARPAPESEYVAIAQPDPEPAAPPTPSAAPPLSGQMPQPGATTMHVPTCTIENCAGCAGLLDDKPQICGKTGREVYPALTDGGARGIAWAVLLVISIGIRIYARVMLGKVLAPIEPTPLEMSELAAAVKEIIRRRAGWIGHAIGDIAACGAALVAYGKRSLNAPTLEEVKAAEIAEASSAPE